MMCGIRAIWSDAQIALVVLIYVTNLTMRLINLSQKKNMKNFLQTRISKRKVRILCFRSGVNLFGCVGLRSAEYCILNKQYSKEEYFDTIEKIKQQMTTVPYVDTVGRSYSYGEMFPPELCMWPFNESTSYEWNPLSKE